MPTIEQRITDIFVAQTQRTVTTETKFIELEWFDSLDVLETVMALEDEFKFEVEDEDYVKWTSVKDVVEYVTRRLAI
jgi:acyl carrier protein